MKGLTMILALVAVCLFAAVATAAGPGSCPCNQSPALAPTTSYAATVALPSESTLAMWPWKTPVVVAPSAPCAPAACTACDSESAEGGRRHPILRIATGAVKAVAAVTGVGRRHARRAARRGGE